MRSPYFRTMHEKHTNSDDKVARRLLATSHYKVMISQSVRFCRISVHLVRKNYTYPIVSIIVYRKTL